MNLREILGDAYKDGMTAEEIEQALANVEMPKDNSAELAKLKASVDRATAEASKYKKELNEKLSADELKAKEEADAREKMERELNELRREKNVSAFNAKFLENGFPADLAKASAEAMYDGKHDVVFANLNKHLSNLRNKFEADYIDRTPKPTGGEGGEHIPTKEEFNNWSYSDQVKLFNTNRELYDKLTS